MSLRLLLLAKASPLSRGEEVKKKKQKKRKTRKEREEREGTKEKCVCVYLLLLLGCASYLLLVAGLRSSIRSMHSIDDPQASLAEASHHTHNTLDTEYTLDTIDTRDEIEEVEEVTANPACLPIDVHSLL